MSIRVMARVWDLSKASGSTLLALLALADHADDDGVCWPGVPRLAQMARVKDRQLQYILRELEAHGELVTLSRAAAHDTNLYLVTTGIDAETITGTLMQRFEMPAGEAARMAAEVVQRNALVQSTAPTGAAECTSVVQPTASEPSINHQEPSIDDAEFAPIELPEAAQEKPAAKKRRGGWTDAEEALLHAYKESSGVEPIGKDYPMWRKVIREWLERGITPEMVRAAVQKLKADKFSYGWPGAATKTLLGMLARQQNGAGKQGTSKRDTGVCINSDGSFYF